MMTHTPGPWFTRQTFSGNWDIAADYGDGKTLARTEKESDARLIAAAPELLDWLKTAAVWIDQTREDERTGEGQNAKALLEDIHAAIAKAEGRES